MPLSEWLSQRGDAIWSGALPTAQFEYSNLGFVLLAACAEQVSGKRFTDLTQNPSGGFNWAGLDTARLDILPTFRRSPDGRFAPQIDVEGATLPRMTEPWVAAEWAQTVSPQGGLRTSLRNLMAIGATLRDHPIKGGWQADPSRTIGPADLFQSYAWGAQIFDAPSFYPRPLIGHFANAYGFCGGVWLDREKDRVFGYALNGLAEGDEDDGLRPEERAIFAAVAQVA